MADFLDEWLSRKRERRLVSIREPRTARFKHQRPLGPRGEFAVVQLHAEPAVVFSFNSHAVWPDSRNDYSKAVLDGILDEHYATRLGYVVAKITFTLEAIEWHDVDSCPAAFYYAARGAIREIIDKAPYNIDLQHD